MLVAQKNAAKDDPTAEDIYEIGCVANILQMLKLPTAPLRCWSRAPSARASSASRRAQAISRRTSCRSCPTCSDGRGRGAAPRDRQPVRPDVKLNKKIPAEILTSIAGIDEAGRLADTIASAPAAEARAEAEDPRDFLQGLTNVRAPLDAQLETEIDILQVESASAAA